VPWHDPEPRPSPSHALLTQLVPAGNPRGLTADDAVRRGSTRSRQPSWSVGCPAEAPRFAAVVKQPQHRRRAVALLDELIMALPYLPAQAHGWPGPVMNRSTDCPGTRVPDRRALVRRRGWLRLVVRADREPGTARRAALAPRLILKRLIRR
jgi:hypothetical protein